jgi:tetratricopeptide (TPR) repeat protein
MGRVLLDLDWNWQGAEREIGRALQLDPSNADVARNAYYLSVQLGRFEEAIRHAKSATILDPLNYFNYLRLGDAEFYGGKFLEAEADYHKALELRPDADLLHLALASVLLVRGKPLDALAEVHRETGDAYRETSLPRFLDAVGQTSEADRALAVAESKYGDTWAFYIGELYASRNDFDRAFLWWDRAYRRHEGHLASIKLAPADSGAKQLASDSRYKDLLRKMNLPE